MDQRSHSPSKKGTGFHQPSGPHKHWHTDVTYVNLGGTFFYLSAVLDGFSRYIVHWELKEQMKEQDIELIIQRALEKHPEATPRIISDNGPQYISNDFKAFVRFSGMTHVRTSPYYPQSNGKIEAWHKSLKKECIRPAEPKTYDEAVRLVERYVNNYNDERLHSALGYITPKDQLEGHADSIFESRDRKLENARAERTICRENARAGGINIDKQGGYALPIPSTEEHQHLPITPSLDHVIPGTATERAELMWANDGSSVRVVMGKTTNISDMRSPDYA